MTEMTCSGWACQAGDGQVRSDVEGDLDGEPASPEEPTVSEVGRPNGTATRGTVLMTGESA